MKYDIDNLKSKRGNTGGKGQKSESRRAETVRDHSHAWAASSTGAYWNTGEKMDKEDGVVSYNWGECIVIDRPVRRERNGQAERFFLTTTQVTVYTIFKLIWDLADF